MTTKLYSERVLLERSGTFTLQPALIEIHDAAIVSIEAQPNTIPEGTHRFGAKVIAPAFVNAHTHLAMSALRGLTSIVNQEGNVIEDVYFKIESELDAHDIRAFTRLGAMESLLHGVGFVWEHYYGGTASAEGIIDVGLEGVVSPTLQDVHGPGTAILDAQLNATETLNSEHFASRGIFAAWGPHATDTVSDTLWHKITEAALRTNLPLHLHLSQSWEEYQRNHTKFEQSPVERLKNLGVLECSFLGVHGLYLSEPDLELLSPDRHTLGFCPGSQVQFGFPAHFDSWHQLKIPWIVGTDCGVSNDSMNVQQELRLVAGMGSLRTTWSLEHERLRQLGTLASGRTVIENRQDAFEEFECYRDPSLLLKTITSIPGSMHSKVKVGQIKVGSRASLLIIDPNHPCLWPGDDMLRSLAYCDAAPAIESMMVGGRWLAPPGEPFREVLLKGDDYQECLIEAHQRRQALFNRLN